jgi:hypothetical protein
MSINLTPNGKNHSTLSRTINKTSAMLVGGVFAVALGVPVIAATGAPPVPVFTSLHDGQVVTTAFPLISGTGQPDTDIQIGYQEIPQGVSTRTDGSGKWSINGLFLKNGPATLQVSNNMEYERTKVSFTVNASPVIKPFTVDGLFSHGIAIKTIQSFVVQEMLARLLA